jgi:hypothetical protein
MNSIPAQTINSLTNNCYLNSIVNNPKLLTSTKREQTGENTRFQKLFKAPHIRFSFSKKKQEKYGY